MRLFNAFKSNIIKYIKVIAAFCSKKSLKNFAGQLYDPEQPDGVKAFSTAAGVFLGIIPILGFQTISAISLAIVFRLNKALVLIFSHISLPPFLPLIIFLSYKMGGYWMGKGINTAASRPKIPVQNFNSPFLQYILGSLTLAVIAAVVTGLLTYAILKLLKAVKQYRQAAVLKDDFIAACGAMPHPR